MSVEWFKPRGYRHFDAPVSSSFAEHISQAQVVERHSWFPMRQVSGFSEAYLRGGFNPGLVRAFGDQSNYGFVGPTAHPSRGNVGKRPNIPKPP